MEILYNESEIPENFVCGIQNRGFGIWKTAQGIQNSSSTDNTGIQYLYVPVLGSLTRGKGVIKH